MKSPDVLESSAPLPASSAAAALQALLRLAHARTRQEDNPLIDEAVALAVGSGAILGLEARVWAAVNLLNRPGPHDAALALAGRATTELASQPGSDTAVNQWRLLLAFHAGKAGYPDISQRLLATIISQDHSLLNVWTFRNPRLRLIGRPDGLVTANGALQPIEIKSHRLLKHSDRMELAFYWLLLSDIRTSGAADPMGWVFLRAKARPWR